MISPDKPYLWIVTPNLGALHLYFRTHGLPRVPYHIVVTRLHAEGARMRRDNTVFVNREETSQEILDIVDHNILVCSPQETS